MELEKNERVNALFAFYQPLLTTKQNDYLQLYYADDFSLGEIAEEFAVSRQAVYDNIRRTEKKFWKSTKINYICWKTIRYVINKRMPFKRMSKLSIQLMNSYNN